MAKKTQSIATMVAGQKRTGREIIGLIAENKVDANKKYVLTAYDAEEGELTFTEQLPDDAPEGTVANVVKITEANAAVMRYVVNPNEKPVPEASVINKDGEKYLKIGEREVYLGTIEAEKVVAGYTGEIILGVKSDEEGQIGLLRYDVQFDKFDSAPFATISADAKVVVVAENTYIINNVIKDVEQIDANGNKIVDENGDVVTKPHLVAAELLQYTGNGHLISRLSDYEEYYDEDEDEYYNEAVSALNVPIESVRLVEQGERKDLAIVTTKEVDDDGYLVTAANATIILFRLSDYARVGSFEVTDAEAKVYLGGSFRKAPVVTVKDSGQILIRDNYGLHVVKTAAVVTAMEGYNYFCGTEVKKDDDENEVVIYTYANKDSAVKSFKMTKSDRGILFEMM